MTEAAGTTERKLKAIAVQICVAGGDGGALQAWGFDDWQDFIILAGIGRDVKTAKSWLRVALAYNMVRCTHGFKCLPASRYGQGANWTKFSDGGV